MRPPWSEAWYIYILSLFPWEGITTQRHDLVRSGAHSEQCRFQLQEKSDIGQSKQLWSNWEWNWETLTCKFNRVLNFCQILQDVVSFRRDQSLHLTMWSRHLLLSSEVKAPLGESSAVECGFSIGGLKQYQTVAAIVSGFTSTAVWCKHDCIYRKRQSGNLHAVGNCSKLTSLLLGLGLGRMFCEQSYHLYQHMANELHRVHVRERN